MSYINVTSYEWKKYSFVFVLPLLTVLHTLVCFLQYFLLVQVKWPETARLVHRYFLHDNQKKVSFSHARSVLGRIWDSSPKLVFCILVSFCWMYNHRSTLYFIIQDHENSNRGNVTKVLFFDSRFSHYTFPQGTAHTRNLIFLLRQLSWLPLCRDLYTGLRAQWLRVTKCLPHILTYIHLYTNHDLIPYIILYMYFSATENYYSSVNTASSEFQNRTYS